MQNLLRILCPCQNKDSNNSHNPSLFIDTHHQVDSVNSSISRSNIGSVYICLRRGYNSTRTTHNSRSHDVTRLLSLGHSNAPDYGKRFFLIIYSTLKPAGGANLVLVSSRRHEFGVAKGDSFTTSSIETGGIMKLHLSRSIPLPRTSNAFPFLRRMNDGVLRYFAQNQFGLWGLDRGSRLLVYSLNKIDPRGEKTRNSSQLAFFVAMSKKNLLSQPPSIKNRMIYHYRRSDNYRNRKISIIILSKRPCFMHFFSLIMITNFSTLDYPQVCSPSLIVSPSFARAVSSIWGFEKKRLPCRFCLRFQNIFEPLSGVSRPAF